MGRQDMSSSGNKQYNGNNTYNSKNCSNGLLGIVANNGTARASSLPLPTSCEPLRSVEAGSSSSTCRQITGRASVSEPIPQARQISNGAGQAHCQLVSGALPVADNSTALPLICQHEFYCQMPSHSVILVDKPLSFTGCSIAYCLSSHLPVVIMFSLSLPLSSLPSTSKAFGMAKAPPIRFSSSAHMLHYRPSDVSR